MKHISGKLRTWGKDTMKGLLFHHACPGMYRLFAKKKIRTRKAVFLEERGNTLSDNCRIVKAAMRRKGGWKLTDVYLHAEQGKARQALCSLRALKDLAGASYVFIDDSSELISCLPLRPETKVVQLWHACGAFKKFGYSLHDKLFGADEKELERFPRHRNFSIVTVSAPEVVWAYAEAFHMEERKEAIVPAGIARTDVFFREASFDRARKALAKCVTRSAGHIVLYAPTFRGNASDARAPQMPDFAWLHRLLGDDWIFLIKQHPFVKERPAVPAEQAGYVFDLTQSMEIDELLMVSDVCISDYSSLVFEFSLLERPMAFFAPDLDEYNDWRGFYYSYEEMTPGPVCTDTQELGEYLAHLDERFDPEQIRMFREKFMCACDGHASQRLLDLLKI